MTTAPASALVPGPLRRPVTLAVVTAASVFAVLAVRYAGTSAASSVDTRIDSVVDPVGTAHRGLFERAMLLGAPPSVAVLALGLSAACLLLGRYRLAVLAVVGPGLTGLSTTLLKPALGRTLDGVFAFPSGHTGGATSLALVAALLVIGLARPRRGSALAILAFGALVIGGGVGTAMVVLNMHYPTDTVGGFCTAVVMVCGAALVLDRLAVVRDAPPAENEP